MIILPIKIEWKSTLLLLSLIFSLEQFSATLLLFLGDEQTLFRRSFDIFPFRSQLILVRVQFCHAFWFAFVMTQYRLEFCPDSFTNRIDFNLFFSLTEKKYNFI